MKKILSTLLFMVACISGAYSQVSLINAEKLVCPGENVSYTASLPSTNSIKCTYKWTVTNGVFYSNLSTTIEATDLREVTVVWNNVRASSNGVAPKGTLRVEITGGCSLPTGESNFFSENNIVIKTLNNVTPGTISGPTNVVLGSNSSITYTVPAVIFPNTGKTDGWTSIEQADSYQWILPAGWKLGSVTSNGTTPITNQGRSISVTPNNCTGNLVKVRAYSSCSNGYVSEWQELSISRPLPTLSFSQAPPNFLVCGETKVFTVAVHPVPNATSYIWTKPNGWSGTSNTNSIPLTADGINDGNITVKAVVCGRESEPLSKKIDVILTDPGKPLSINGRDAIGSTGEKFLINNLPENFSGVVQWNKSSNLREIFKSDKEFHVAPLNTSKPEKAWVQAIVKDACGNTSELLVKNLWIGYANANDRFYVTTSFYGGQRQVLSSMEAYTSSSIYISPALNRTDAMVKEYEWQVTGNHNSPSLNLKASSLSLVSSTFPNNKLTVRLRMRNDIGWGEWSTLTIWTRGGEYEPWFVYPVPADDEITIEQTSNINGFSDYSQNYEVKLFNSHSNEVLNKNYKGGKIKLSTSELKNGIYYLHIRDKDKIYRKRIIITHQ